MFHLNAWIFSYQQCKTSGISANMHALGIRQIAVNIKKRMRAECCALWKPGSRSGPKRLSVCEQKINKRKQCRQ